MHHAGAESAFSEVQTFKLPENVIWIDSLHFTEFPNQSAKLGTSHVGHTWVIILSHVAAGHPLLAPWWGHGEHLCWVWYCWCDVPTVLASSTTHSTITTFPSNPNIWRRRMGKVHPPDPQPGAFDTAGGWGSVVQDGRVAGEALVLRGLHLNRV